MPTAWLTYDWDDNIKGDIDFLAGELRGKGLTVNLDRQKLGAGREPKGTHTCKIQLRVGEAQPREIVIEFEGAEWQLLLDAERYAAEIGSRGYHLEGPTVL